jgi:hypothetical protein
MEDAPDDILRLIFETYVHDLQLSPANLLTVNRRWHALLVGVRSLWTRISIVIDSFSTIPFIIGTQRDRYVDMDTLPLPIYLQRSGELPLDISIHWKRVDTRPKENKAAMISYVYSNSPLLGCMRVEYYRPRKHEDEDDNDVEEDETDVYYEEGRNHVCEMQTDELIMCVSIPFPG